MENEANLFTVLGVAITAVCGIVVAWISTRGGKRTANSSPDPVEETGEHAHTRTTIKGGIKILEAAFKRLETTIEYEIKDIHLRFDRLERARQVERQSQQLGKSQQRLDEYDERDDEE